MERRDTSQKPDHSGINSNGEVRKMEMMNEDNSFKNFDFEQKEIINRKNTGLWGRSFVTVLIKRGECRSIFK